MPVRTYHAHGRNAQPPFAVNMPAVGEVSTMLDAYGGDVGATRLPSPPDSRSYEYHSAPSYAVYRRSAPAQDPRRSDPRAARWTPPQSSGGGGGALPPIQQSRRSVHEARDEQRGGWEVAERNAHDSGRGIERDGERGTERGSVVLSEIADLEHRVRATEATSRTLLRQALVASAEIDRAWQVLTAAHGDGRAASEAQRRLLKDHIRSITEVVHKLTTELDQVEVAGRHEVARLDASLAQSTRAQQQAIATLTATQSAAHGRIAAELQALKIELSHAREARTRLESVVERQRDDMQRMAADFDAKIAELAHRQTESDHAAQQGLQRLHSEARADAEAHARAVDGAHAAVNKTRAAVDALRDDVRKGFEQLQHDVTEQAHADASALVGALRVQVEEHAATAAANKEATDERMDKMTTDMNDHVEARFRDAKDSARAHVNALNQELQEVIRSLEIQVNNVELGFGDKMDGLANKTRKARAEAKNKSDAKTVARIESRLVAEITRLEARAAEAEGKIDVLAALLQTKTEALERKVAASSYVVLS